MAVQTENTSRGLKSRLIVSAIALLMVAGSVKAADAGQDAEGDQGRLQVSGKDAGQ